MGERVHHVLQPAVVAEAKVGTLIPAFLTLGLEQAQDLVDELWRCGLRPTEGSGSAGALAATQRHLDDLRALHFGTVGLEPPK